MNFVVASSFSFQLTIMVWVMVGAEADSPVGATVTIPIAIAAALYKAYQCLHASFTKDDNDISIAPILCCT